MTVTSNNAISRELLCKIVDEVFDGAVEDAGVIEEIHAVIVRDMNDRSSHSAEAGKPVVKVKPLEWCNGYRDWQVKIQTASSGPFYQVRELDGVVWLDADNTQTIYPSVEAAKAAAQADYEARVRSALSTPADSEPVAWPEIVFWNGAVAKTPLVLAEALENYASVQPVRGREVWAMRAAAEFIHKLVASGPLYAAPVADGEPVSVPEGVSNNRELLQALSRLADNRHSDGISSLVSREDRTAIINGCYDLMIAARAAAPQPNPSKVDAGRLIERGQAFANQVRCITRHLHGQAYSTTVSELNAFDAALAAQGEKP